MLELETLLLGLEPITALTIGAGALILVPAIGTIDSMTGNSFSDSARGVAKTGLVLALDTFDKGQRLIAEAGESFQDLVAEAKSERNKPTNGAPEAPREVSIVSQ